MCKAATREQQIEGWRAVGALLAIFGRPLIGAIKAILAAPGHRGDLAAGRRRT